MAKAIYDAKKDPMWGHPVIDADEMRERELLDKTVVKYRYMHGYFEDTAVNGTDVKFTFCFPEKERYTGRFFQHLCPFPGPNEENAYFDRKGRDDLISFSIVHGAGFIACNMGSGELLGQNADSSMVYKSFAAAAEHFRQKAIEIYDCGRPYGYVFGASGGGYKSMSCIENTNAWDGAVPHVIGSPVSIPNCMCVPSFGKRVLRHKIADIIEALDVGGSGEPAKLLDAAEKDAYEEVTAMGFPPRTWFMMEEGIMDDGSLVVLAPVIHMADASYFSDFWTKSGYAGFEREESVMSDLVKLTSKVKEVHLLGEAEDSETGTNGANNAFLKQLGNAANSFISLEEAPEQKDLYAMGMEVRIESGEATGAVLKAGSIVGNQISIGATYGVANVDEILAKVKPGDQVTLTNEDYLAIQLYYRYQDVSEDFFPWSYLDQKYPNRPKRQGDPVGMMICANGAGSLQDGDLQGKIIVVEALMDEFASPWQAHWYRNKVRASASEKGIAEEDVFRLWYIDHSLHNDSQEDGGTRTVNYSGAVKRALLAVSDWVERGVKPAESTEYALDFAQLVVPKDAAQRKGVQQTVTLYANNEESARVKAGETVQLTAVIKVPAAGETVVAASWNFTGEGKTTYGANQFADVFGPESTDIVATGDGSFLAKSSCIYTTPGLYYAVVKTVTNPCPQGARDPFLDVLNIGRVRIQVDRQED
ncbi:MAG: hypothetical protein LBT59_25320 [Clostridiales bacterium]|nr:hypothetical protein [Clostridiales bacterium]